LHPGITGNSSRRGFVVANLGVAYRGCGAKEPMRNVLKQLIAILAMLPLIVPQAFAEQVDPSREQAFSMTVTQYGIVATSQTVASQAGAAIAANAALGVIEPMMNGVGGDLFATVYIHKTGKLYGLNSSGWSPKGLSM